MGQKVNPYGFRLGITTEWKSRWFSERDYKQYLTEDWTIRREIMTKLESAAISRIEVEAASTVELPEGAVEAPEDGSIPAGYEIKGNANSMTYHVPGGRYDDVTIAEVFFDTPEHAEAAGYEAPAADTEESN